MSNADVIPRLDVNLSATATQLGAIIAHLERDLSKSQFISNEELSAANEQTDALTQFMKIIKCLRHIA